MTLLDKLLEKGVITTDDWLQIKADEEKRAAEQTVVTEFTTSPRWYERIRMYGYGMFRYNRLGHPNEKVNSWLDASVGKEQPGFFDRRIRWVVTGQVSDRVGFYIQPDLASNVDGNTHSLTMRDAWGEYYLNLDKEYRIRVGLQRVPCSFDNWQASRQRLAIDRADATTSCQAPERDLGISYQWTPKYLQHRWKEMIDYLYGAGDWGMVNVTVYNGQGNNQPERNDDKHVGLRLAYPFELPGGRLFEVGMNAMRGMYNVNPGTPSNTNQSIFSFTDDRLPNGTPINLSARRNYLDERINFYVYYPPQPWGFQAEYVTGRGPKRGSDGLIRDSSLYGGYVQLHYLWKYSDLASATFYGRYQEYYGGVKSLVGAPDDRMKELELGVAWMPDPQWKVTLAYALTQRLNTSQMANYATGNCSNNPIPTVTTGGAPVVLPPDNSSCTPSPQVNASANLIRVQIIWFWN
jgi:hypothetical protein